jgi:hypothetical protein
MQTSLAWPIPVVWIVALVSSSCARVVEPAASGSGGAGRGVSTIGSSSALVGSTTGAGGGSVGPLGCVGSGLFVGAGSPSISKASLRGPDGWLASHQGPPAREVAAVLDPYEHFSLFRIGLDGAPSYVRTGDGATYEEHPVEGFAPLDSLASPRSFGDVTTILLGRTAEGPTLAMFDPDAFDWYGWQSVPSGFDVTSSIALSSQSGITVAGRGPSGTLCWGDGPFSGPLTGTSCLPDAAPSGGEIPVTPPSVVSLLGGDEVFFYFSSAGGAVSARTRHAGVFGPASTLADHRIGVRFAATATRLGDALLVVSATSGELSIARYDTVKGFGPLVHVASDAGIESPLAATPGVCGNDALFAYVAETDHDLVRVVRVSGMAALAEDALAFAPGDRVLAVDLATKKASD